MQRLSQYEGEQQQALLSFYQGQVMGYLETVVRPSLASKRDDPLLEEMHRRYVYGGWRHSNAGAPASAAAGQPATNGEARSYEPQFVAPSAFAIVGLFTFLDINRSTLNACCCRWGDHKLLTEWMRRLFKCLDRPYQSISKDAREWPTCSLISSVSHYFCFGVSRGVAGRVNKPDPTLTSQALKWYRTAVFDKVNKQVSDCLVVSWLHLPAPW